MKKVGIITINDFNNYGNRLQNYALQEILFQLRMNPENILNNNIPVEKSRLKVYLKKIIKLIINVFTAKQKQIKRRKSNFKSFNDKYMHNTINTIYMDKIAENFHERYDYIVVGSDQIWNYNLKRIPKIDFALFSPKEKNVSYAASFGVDCIEGKWKEKYKKGLNNIKTISVREERGKEIVKELTNREATVVLDPTLLLTKNDWNKILKKPDIKIKRRYILTYLLGKYDKHTKKRIETFANEKGLMVINLGKIQYKKYYSAGPREFLWYIKNAEIVFTDSFHASVFSILFNTTFYVLERNDSIESMNSRIETLLKKFKLQKQKFKDWNNISIEHDYSQAYNILQQEKKKSMDFLKKALI